MLLNFKGKLQDAGFFDKEKMRINEYTNPKDWEYFGDVLERLNSK